MDLIDEFVARYTKEYDFYQQAGRLAAQLIESSLRAAGIRSIVTSRAKSVSRLEDKCRQRSATSPYSSVDAIFDDIVDLSGVRVALYFPAERQQVHLLVTRLFRQIGERKEFPDSSKTTTDKRFSGYSAFHYRVQLKEAELSEIDRRYSAARIEIQVASVLMHAWAEVDHDLVYKPLKGELSDEERIILDQLNGMILAGEIALELLQRAGEARVAVDGRRFENHYELAAHLIGRAATVAEDPVPESGLGRGPPLLIDFRP